MALEQGKSTVVTVTHSDRIRLLIVSPQCDANDLGESWAAYHWISRLGQKCDVTLLTLRESGRKPASEQLPGVRVIEWPPFPNLARCARFRSMVKPWYPSFYVRVRRWICEASNSGEQFDLMHHLTPVAMRYPSPCVGLHPLCDRTAIGQSPHTTILQKGMSERADLYPPEKP